MKIFTFWLNGPIPEPMQQDLLGITMDQKTNISQILPADGLLRKTMTKWPLFLTEDRQADLPALLLPLVATPLVTAD